MPDILDNHEWLESRGITNREAGTILRQLDSEFIYIRRAIRGEVVPSALLERELIELVVMTKQGRFPVDRPSGSRNLSD